MDFCKVITGVILLLSLVVIFFCMHVVGCVFLCPRNARVALACASWRATTARALWNRLLGSRDPPARSILRERRHTNRIQHDASLNRTNPRFPLRGTARASFCFSDAFDRSGSLCYRFSSLFPPLGGSSQRKLRDINLWCISIDRWPENNAWNLDNIAYAWGAVRKTCFILIRQMIQTFGYRWSFIGFLK